MPEAREGPDIRLRLVQGFRLTVDDRLCDPPPTAGRLLAYLGLHPHPVPRTRVASVLWDGQDERHSAACLRSAIWRANTCTDRPLVTTDHTLIGLHDSVRVDVRTLGQSARDLLGGLDRPLSAQELSGELLPGWDDEWVVLEREQLRLLCLEALEQLAEAHLAGDRTRQAIEAALTLAAVEPLREAAYLLLVRGYLRSGNRPEAWRQYQRCREVLWHELGLPPGAELAQLVARTFPTSAPLTAATA